MIITGSIVGVLKPDSSIFIQACRVSGLIENTNESRACERARVMRTLDVAAFNTAVCTFEGVRV